MIMSMRKNHELEIFVIMSMSQLTTLVSEFMNCLRIEVSPGWREKPDHGAQ
jgi:hypothetical protein